MYAEIGKKKGQRQNLFTCSVGASFTQLRELGDAIRSNGPIRQVTKLRGLLMPQRGQRNLGN